MSVSTFDKIQQVDGDLKKKKNTPTEFLELQK